MRSSANPSAEEVLSPVASVPRVAGAPPPLADYDLIRQIGAGAYGEVWIGRSTTGAVRAVKLVYRASFADERPFLREFEGIQKFEEISRSHPSQLALFHVGRHEASGCFYYVMELADPAPAVSAQSSVISDPSAGSSPLTSASLITDALITGYSPRTLRSDLAAGRLPAARVLELALALTEALSHLHARGLVHRDIKPSNIIFVAGRPKLADIGLVTDAGDDGLSIVGTVGYLPPEGPGTPAADLFALSRVLYEALTGLDRRKYPELPADLSTWPDRALALELNAVLVKTGAADVRQRYPSAEAMLADLKRLGAGKSVKRLHVVKRRMRTAGWVLAGVSVVAMAVLGGMGLRESSRKQVKGRTQGWTTNQAAWDAYLVAGNIGDNLTQSTHANALAEYERAIALDPNFAYARAEMALQMVCNRYGGMPAGPVLAGAKAAAEKALARDPSLGRGWQALAIIAAAEHRLSLAENHYRRAIQVDPDEFFGHLNFAGFLINCGRLAEAREQLDAAQRLNPVWPHVHGYRSQIEMLAGRFDRALQEVGSAIDLQPNRASGYVTRGDIHWERGDRASAAADWLHAFRLSDMSEPELSEFRNALDSGGPTGFVRAKIDWLKRRLGNGEHGLHFAIATDHARLGERELALFHLDLAVDEQLAEVLAAKVDPEFRSLRDEPRFQDILRRLGFPER